MSGHTKGPWAVHPRWPEVVTPAGHADRPWGGSIHPDKNRDYYLQQICTVSKSDPFGRGSRDANARLIAAAPDGLAVAKAFVAHYPMGINPFLDQAYRDARAFIARATEAQ